MHCWNVPYQRVPDPPADLECGTQRGQRSPYRSVADIVGEGGGGGRGEGGVEGRLWAIWSDLGGS